MAKIAVAPLVGAWIEIKKPVKPSGKPRVAPLVGAWIEILNCTVKRTVQGVAPLVGAWIEICSHNRTDASYTSLPSWERGLK